MSVAKQNQESGSLGNETQDLALSTGKVIKDSSESVGPRLNIELFKKIRERIATIPESYDQSFWAKEAPKAPCGTAACLAGEAIICDAPTVSEGIKRLEQLLSDGSTLVPCEAARLLGLQGDYLSHGDEGETAIFFGSGMGWPEPYQSLFLSAASNSLRAEVAVSLLDHIIETGKVLE